MSALLIRVSDSNMLIIKLGDFSICCCDVHSTNLKAISVQRVNVMDSQFTSNRKLFAHSDGNLCSWNANQRVRNVNRRSSFNCDHVDTAKVSKQPKCHFSSCLPRSLAPRASIGRPSAHSQCLIQFATPLLFPALANPSNVHIFLELSRSLCSDGRDVTSPTGYSGSSAR